MPPRRTHTKSRNGCDQCKTRRVKCDERGPPCSNCVSRELGCTYKNVPRAQSPGKRPSFDSASLRPGGSGRAQDAVAIHEQISLSRRLNLRALELMHQFSTETYQSLCTDPTNDRFWKLIMPRRALDYDFLMCGILAVASLHIASTKQPPEALSYIDTALEYHTQAFGPFRQEIANLTESNCDAVFAYSVILIVIGIALPRMTAERGEISSMTENIMVVAELLQGASNIVRISRPWLEQKQFSSMKQFFNNSTAPIDDESEAALNQLSATSDRMLVNATVEQQRVITDAMALLRHCFSRYSATRDSAAVVSWLASIDKEFVNALRCREPLSLLVLMHWAVLLGELNGKVWWASNSGQALVSEILAALRPSGIQWEGAWLWPKQKLGL